MTESVVVDAHVVKISQSILAPAERNRIVASIAGGKHRWKKPGEEVLVGVGGAT